MVKLARKSRTPSLIDQVRTGSLSLVNCNSYLPASLVRRAKIEAIDRDVALRLLNSTVESSGDWPSNVVPITGTSGVIAQVLRDHFAALDERDSQQTVGSQPKPKPKDTAVAKRRSTR